MADKNQNQPTAATATPVYQHFGNRETKDFGRSRNVKVGDTFKLIGTRPDDYQGNAFTRWQFERSDKSLWEPSETKVGMWSRKYYPQHVGNPEALFNELASRGQITVTAVSMVEDDFQNKVQCVKF